MRAALQDLRPAAAAAVAARGAPLLTLTLLLGHLLGGCGSETPLRLPRPRVFPPGTVLAVDGLAVGADEVERVAAWVGLLKPEEVQAARRRQALTAVVLPRAAVAATWPEERAAARTAARARLAELRGEAFPAGPPQPLFELEGTWGELGLELWGAALEGPLGEWHGPQEAVGRFWLVRRLGSSTPTPQAATTVRIQCAVYDYLPPGTLSEEVVDQSLLEIVDPAWRELVPAAWIHRMRGTRP